MLNKVTYINRSRTEAVILTVAILSIMISSLVTLPKNSEAAITVVPKIYTTATTLDATIDQGIA